MKYRIKIPFKNSTLEYEDLLRVHINKNKNKNKNKTPTDYELEDNTQK